MRSYSSWPCFQGSIVTASVNQQPLRPPSRCLDSENTQLVVRPFSSVMATLSSASEPSSRRDRKRTIRACRNGRFFGLLIICKKRPYGPVMRRFADDANRYAVQIPAFGVGSLYFWRASTSMRTTSLGERSGDGVGMSRTRPPHPNIAAMNPATRPIALKYRPLIREQSALAI